LRSTSESDTRAAKSFFARGWYITRKICLGEFRKPFQHGQSKNRCISGNIRSTGAARPYRCKARIIKKRLHTGEERTRLYAIRCGEPPDGKCCIARICSESAKQEIFKSLKP
jgi:hypothetical protein